MNWTIDLGGDLHIVGVIFSCLLGYLDGYLLRDLNFRKIIAAYFVIPCSIIWLIDINDVMFSTIPFLLSAWSGHIGLEKTKYYATESFDIGRELIRKWR